MLKIQMLEQIVSNDSVAEQRAVQERHNQKQQQKQNQREEQLQRNQSPKTHHVG